MEKSIEQKWMLKLKKCLEEMPKGYKLFVRHGCAELVTEKEAKMTFEKYGHYDQAKFKESIETKRLEPHGESM